MSMSVGQKVEQMPLCAKPNSVLMHNRELFKAYTNIETSNITLRKPVRLVGSNLLRWISPKLPWISYSDKAMNTAYNWPPFVATNLLQRKKKTVTIWDWFLDFCKVSWISVLSNCNTYTCMQMSPGSYMQTVHTRTKSAVDGDHLHVGATREVRAKVNVLFKLINCPDLCISAAYLFRITACRRLIKSVFCFCYMLVVLLQGHAPV